MKRTIVVGASITALFLAAIQGAHADVPASPVPATASISTPAKPSPPPSAAPKRADFADYVAAQIRTLEGLASQGASFQSFAASVYEPYCRTHGGLAKSTPVTLVKPPGAWPAAVRCADASVIHTDGPQ